MNKLNDELTKHNTKLTFCAIKESRGITLVVLIITIVVLLILAGITIANITGGDGVIEQASSKKDETTIANEKQILGNAAISASDKFGEITENNLRQALSNQNVEITKSGGLYRIVFKDTNNLYKMNKDGEFFYWEDMKPTDIYAKKDGTTLYLRSTQPDTSYVKGTQWKDSTITKIIIEEPIAPKSCFQMFDNCSNLLEIENIENLHTENVSYMESMFRSCSKLTKLDLRFFDTSNCTSFQQMFSNCNNLTELYLNNFNTENVTNMQYMFSGCTNLKNLDLTNFSTNNLNNMTFMFFNCNSLTSLDLSSFNTSKINNMTYLFRNCSKLEYLNLSNFDTSAVQSMRLMFDECKSLKTLDLSSFDTSSITNYELMFSSCSKLQTIYVSDKFIINEGVADTNMFYGCDKLVGGNGTKFTSAHRDSEYARIDKPGTPGYFTEKASN